MSRDTGRFLATIVTAMQANRILEVGTGYGYATLWMALAQPSVGRIWTIDPDAAKTDVARSYFRRAAEDDYIEVFNTPALELLENFPHRNLDIVFVAANAAEYDAYLDTIVPMLKLSGLAIFSDALATRGFARALPVPSGAGLGARGRQHGDRRSLPVTTSAADFKHAMRHVPTGVTVVTTLKEGEPRGITVNAFASVSLEPPSLLICINREARSYLFISSSRVFCVNVLAGDQRRLAEHFSGKVRERQFAEIGYSVDSTGAPVLERRHRALRLRAVARVSDGLALDPDRARALVQRAGRLAAGLLQRRFSRLRHPRRLSAR